MTERRLRPPPDLHALIRQHGGFAAVPDAAWKQYQRAVEAWKHALRRGALDPRAPPERCGDVDERRKPA